MKSLAVLYLSIVLASYAQPTPSEKSSVLPYDKKKAAGNFAKTKNLWDGYVYTDIDQIGIKIPVFSEKNIITFNAGFRRLPTPAEIRSLQKALVAFLRSIRASDFQDFYENVFLEAGYADNRPLSVDGEKSIRQILRASKLLDLEAETPDAKTPDKEMLFRFWGLVTGMGNKAAMINGLAEKSTIVQFEVIEKPEEINTGLSDRYLFSSPNVGIRFLKSPFLNYSADPYQVLAKQNSLYVANVKMYIRLGEPFNHAFPVVIALFLDEGSGKWIPCELADLWPSPDKSFLFF